MLNMNLILKLKQTAVRVERWRGDVMDLKLYMLDRCPYCQKVMTAIKEKGIEDKFQYFSVTEPENNAYVLEKGGQDMCPCLFIDDKPMYESSDIVEWINKHSK